MEMTELEKVIEEWEAVLSRDPLDAPWDLIDETLALLKEQETVVRCKDCKNLSSPANGVPFCKHIKKFVGADWFCADGVAKDKTVLNK